MSINIRTDFMQHAELFGNPVLFTNWLIQRDTIPKDWYCYDLRGTRQSPNVKIALVDKTARYHAGTVLSPTPLKRKETASRRVNSAFHLLGEEMTLEQFCEEHSLEYPQDDRKFAIKAASFDEAALFLCHDAGGGPEAWLHWTCPNGLRPPGTRVLAHLVAPRSRGTEQS